MSSSIAMPSGRLWAAYFREMRFEFLKMLRTPAFSVPTLFFPVMFYFLFGILLGSMRGNAAQAVVTFANFGVFGAMGPGLFGFGVSVAIEREYGLLRFKQALPQPAGAYLLARACMTMVFVAVITVLLTLIALTLGKADLTAGQVVHLFFINVLGALPFCAIGMYVGWLVSGQGAPAILNFVFLPMSFLSGLFIPLQVMPTILQKLAVIFPSYHLSQMAQSVVGAPSSGRFSTHVTVLALTTVVFFMLAVRRMHGSGFRLLGANPKRTVAVAVVLAAVSAGLSFIGGSGDRTSAPQDAPAATTNVEDAPASTDGAAPAVNDKPADSVAPAEPLLTDFEAGHDRAAWGQGLFASGDENQKGKSTASQQVIAGGAGGSRHALEVTGEVRLGAPYPTAGTFFFPSGQIMQSTVDLSAKKSLSVRLRGDGKSYTLMVFTAGSYIPLMQSVTATDDWQVMTMDFSRYVGADFKHVLGFGIVSMSLGPFRFQIDDLRLE